MSPSEGKTQEPTQGMRGLRDHPRIWRGAKLIGTFALVAVALVLLVQALSSGVDLGGV
jgi:hypothetical protein